MPGAPVTSALEFEMAIMEESFHCCKDRPFEKIDVGSRPVASRTPEVCPEGTRSQEGSLSYNQQRTQSRTAWSRKPRRESLALLSS